jgi:triosephosphate isomerase
MSRKFWVGGTWKMNGSKNGIKGIVAFLKAGPLDPAVEVVGVSALCLEYTKNLLPPSVEVSAQNCYKVSKGAFTGMY